MNIANITRRFALLCGMELSEAASWQSIIKDAMEYIRRRLIKQPSGGSDTARLEMLCAAYAYKTYCLCNDNGVTAFTAGEVHIASPVRDGNKAEELWQKLLNESADLICSDRYIFGRVIE